jgi:hypothetical protein
MINYSNLIKFFLRIANYILFIIYRLGHWVIWVVSRTLTRGYPSRNTSLDGWVMWWGHVRMHVP